VSMLSTKTPPLELRHRQPALAVRVALSEEGGNSQEGDWEGDKGDSCCQYGRQ
jgi:hypothetical protein